LFSAASLAGPFVFFRPLAFFSRLEVVLRTGGQGGRIPDLGGGMEDVVATEVEEPAREGPRGEEEMLVCFRFTPELEREYA